MPGPPVTTIHEVHSYLTTGVPVAARGMGVSVRLTVRASGDPAELERRAAAHPDAIRTLAASALSHGLISHRFCGTDGGETMVLDEWESEEGFRAVFAANPQIGERMAEVGVTAAPRSSSGAGSRPTTRSERSSRQPVRARWRRARAPRPPRPRRAR